MYQVEYVSNFIRELWKKSPSLCIEIDEGALARTEPVYQTGFESSGSKSGRVCILLYEEALDRLSECMYRN